MTIHLPGIERDVAQALVPPSERLVSVNGQAIDVQRSENLNLARGIQCRFDTVQAAVVAV